MVREDEIDKTYTVTLNGTRFTATITQDPSQYEFYTALGLDVFEQDERTILKAKLDSLGISYRSNSGLSTLQSKLDDYTEGDY